MSNEIEWFRSHVERLLREVWELAEVTPDGDGDYPFRGQTARGWVGILPGEPLTLRVWAFAAHGLRPTARLLRELSEICAQVRFGSGYWHGGHVLVEYSLPAVAVDAEVLAGVCGVVVRQADDIGPLLAAMYGGQTPHAPSASHDDAGTDAA